MARFERHVKTYIFTSGYSYRPRVSVTCVNSDLYNFSTMDSARGLSSGGAEGKQTPTHTLSSSSSSKKGPKSSSFL